MCSSWTCRPMPTRCSSPMRQSTSRPTSTPSATSCRTRSISSPRSASARHGSQSCPRSKPSPRKSPRPSRPRRSARWRTAARSPAAARRTARVRQRDRSRSGAHQGHFVSGRGAGADPGRARSRSRQHARQEPHLPGKGRRGRHRPRRAGTDHPDLARRLGAHPHGFVRGRSALRPCTPHRRAAAGCVTAHGPDPCRQRRVVERQVSSLRDRRCERADASNQRAGRRHRHAAATAGTRAGRD